MQLLTHVQINTCSMSLIYLYIDDVISHLIASLREELDGGERLDFDVVQLVGSGVHLGHNNILVVLELLTQLVPDRHQLFAVSAPWGVCNRQRRVRNSQSDYVC